MAGKIWPTVRWAVIRTKWGIKSWLIFTPMAVVHRSAHPYLFLQFLRSPAGHNCLTYPPSNHKHFLHSQKRSSWALHFLFDFTACNQMEPSWGNFFLLWDRKFVVELGFFHVGQCSLAKFCLGCSETESCVKAVTVESEEELFPGGPAWVNSAQRGSVSLTSIIDPCTIEGEKNEGAKTRGESFPLVWS